MPPRKYHRISSAAAYLGAFLLMSGAVQAQQVDDEGRRQWGEDPISAILKWRPYKETPAMQDFVKQTRPDENSLDFQPTRLPPADQPKERTAEDVQKMKNELEARAARNRARAQNDFNVPSYKPSGGAAPDPSSLDEPAQDKPKKKPKAD